MDSSKFRIFKKVAGTCHSDRFSQVLRSGFRFILSKLHNATFFGESQVNFYTTIRHWAHQLRYSAVAKPYMPIWVDPMRINFRNCQFMTNLGLGQIRGGNWDSHNNCTPIEEQTVYCGLKQRFEENRDWTDTVYYKSAKEEFKNNKSKWGYDNLKHFLDVRCRYVDELYNSIKENGYRPNYMIEHNVPETDTRSNPQWYHSKLEPLVVISRDGDIYLDDGLHRFSIARILNIAPIPVNVLGRHNKWQNVREKFDIISESSEIDTGLENYVDHPDIIRIISDSDPNDGPTIKY